MFTKIIGALGVAMALNSCATVIRGVHEDLKVVSNPSGADVTLSSGERGITPATFVKLRRNSFQVTVSKPGYYSQTVTVRSKASTTGAAATAGNVATLGSVSLSMLELEHGTRFIRIRSRFGYFRNPGEHPARQRRLARGGYPVATPTERGGIVRSPYTRRLYDVHAVPHGSLVHDVDVNKLFLNP